MFNHGLLHDTQPRYFNHDTEYGGWVSWLSIVAEYRVEVLGWVSCLKDFNHGLQPRTLVVWITPPYLSLCKTKHIFLLYCWLQYQRLVFKIFPEGPFTRAIFCCDFLLLINMNKRIKKECAECALPHRNIRHWFTPWHPSKIAAKIACVSGPFGWWTHKLYTYMQYTLNIYSIYTLYILYIYSTPLSGENTCNFAFSPRCVTFVFTSFPFISPRTVTMEVYVVYITETFPTVFTWRIFTRICWKRRVWIFVGSIPLQYHLPLLTCV
jgi:hypothetical protein